MESSLRSALIAEAYGTFLLVFIGCTSITIFSNPQKFPAGQYLGLGFIGLAFGSALLVGIATVAQISGAHFNPAVTIALARSGRFPKDRILPYIGAQVVGAVLASLAQLSMVGVTIAKTTDLGNTTVNSLLPSPILAALIAEVLGTMILTMTILGTTDKDSFGWGPSVIGLSLSAVIWATGGIAGASLNPARTFGPTFVSLFFDHAAANYYWVYLLGPVLGALLASEIYRTMRGR